MWGMMSVAIEESGRGDRSEARGDQNPWSAANCPSISSKSLPKDDARRSGTFKSSLCIAQIKSQVVDPFPMVLASKDAPFAAEKPKQKKSVQPRLK